MKPRAWLRSLVLLPALLWIAAACGGTDPEPPTAEGLTGQGWEAFRDGDYAAAAARFEDALALDAEYADAWTGLGWVALRRGDASVAETRLAGALERDPGALDAAAGLVLAAALSNDADAVLARSGALIEGAPGYVFPHDPRFAASDVRWLAARAALDLGDYARLLAEMDVLRPGHGLDPAAPDFLDRALALLETLQGAV